MWPHKIYWHTKQLDFFEKSLIGARDYFIENIFGYDFVSMFFSFFPL